MNWYKNAFELIQKRNDAQYERRLLQICLILAGVVATILTAIYIVSETYTPLYPTLIYFLAIIVLLGLVTISRNPRPISILTIVFLNGYMITCIFIVDLQLASITHLLMATIGMIPLIIFVLNHKQWFLFTILLLTIMTVLYTAEQTGVIANTSQMSMVEFTAFALVYFSISFVFNMLFIAQDDEEMRDRRAVLQAYQTIHENLPIGVYRSSVDGKQIRANRTLYELNGYESEQEQIEGVNDIATEWYVDPKRREEFKKTLAENDVVYGFESEIYRHKTRERIWISETARTVCDRNGNILFYEGTVQDITERKLAEQAERMASEQLTLITNNLPAYIVYVDAGLQLQFANQTLLNALEMEAKDVLGQNAIDVLGREEYLAEAKSRVARVLNGEQFNFEVKVPYPNSKMEYGYGIYVPHFQDGEVVGFFTMLLDMTKERQAEELLRQTQRLDSLGVLAGGIAHDFNNLLTAILGQLSLSLIKSDEDNVIYRHVVKAKQAAEKSADLCQQLLAYSGRGHFQVTTLNVNDIIHDNIDMLKVGVPPNVELNYELQTSLPHLQGDTTQLQQVIMNLIINGAEATQGKGTVNVRTQIRELAGSETEFWMYTGRPLVSGDYVSIVVEDDGDGIDSATLKQIFDPFFTTKSTGHGLGLAAVLGIIRGHKGGLYVQSTVGQGTTFELLFPVAPEPEQPLMPTESKDNISDAQSILVLIIDDDPVVRESLRDILEGGGHQVIEAADGSAGIEQYQVYGEQVGIIILDLTMPGLSGKETLIQLRLIDPAVPIILSSGYHHADIFSERDNVMPNAFLQKPYTADKMLNIVHQYARRSSAD